VAVTGVVVRALAPEERRAAAGVTARALADSPTTVAMYGHDLIDGLVGLYEELTEWFALLPGPQLAAFAGSWALAAAAVAPPERCIGAFMAGRPPGVPGAPEPGPGDPARAELFWARWALADCPDEHWHVGPVGVEPGFQGRGIGAGLLRELCADFDAHGRVAWLETDKQRNVRFYAGHGFEVAARETILDVPTWYMRRDPRP